MTQSLSRRLGTAALDLLFPPKCPFCTKLLRYPRGLICPTCRGSLPWLVGEEAERHVDFMEVCVSPLRYRDQVRDSVRRYKFSGLRCYAKVYGTLCTRCARLHFPENFDLITWVPVSRKRLRERGYDQAYLLCRETAAGLGAECVELLRKIRDNPTQSGIDSDAARRGNVLGVYEALSPQLLSGRRVLLVDDVVTTGATLSECARILLENGAAAVYGLTLARAR